MIECKSCGETFSNIGTHYRYNESHRPNITDYQMEIITGLLMSDGSISTYGNSNPQFRVEMTNREYLEWLDCTLGWLSTGVKNGRTKEELGENCNDLFYLTTRRHPDLSPLLDWYESGRKIWPKNLRLTPTILKHLYIGDGTFVSDKEYLKIALHNEREYQEKINYYFTRVGLPEPDYWNMQERSTEVKWLNPKPLFDYMEDAPPGFEYKWPNQNL